MLLDTFLTSTSLHCFNHALLRRIWLSSIWQLVGDNPGELSLFGVCSTSRVHLIMSLIYGMKHTVQAVGMELKSFVLLATWTVFRQKLENSKNMLINWTQILKKTNIISTCKNKVLHKFEILPNCQQDVLNSSVITVMLLNNKPSPSIISSASLCFTFLHQCAVTVFLWGY